jgi:hypothetical protein
MLHVLHAQGRWQAKTSHFLWGLFLGVFLRCIQHCIRIGKRRHVFSLPIDAVGNGWMISP